MKHIIKDLKVLNYNFLYETGSIYYYPSLKVKNKKVRTIIDNRIDPADHIEEISDASRLMITIDMKCSGCIMNVFYDDSDTFLNDYFQKFFNNKNYHKCICTNLTAYKFGDNTDGMYVWLSLKHKDNIRYR